MKTPFPTALPEQSDAFASGKRAFDRRIQIIAYAHAEHGFFYDLARRCQRPALDNLMQFIRSCGPSGSPARINTPRSHAND